MSKDWNKLAGELRSSLAARDWHQAGAIVWQLRQLDGERFTIELEHYTNEQVRKGGYGMALETEQRLEAVKQWAREKLQSEEGGQWRGRLNEAISGRPRLRGSWLASIAWDHEQRLRSDMSDAIWSVLAELDMLDTMHPESSYRGL